MTLKEIKSRYKRVFLGFLWSFLNPIFQMIVIGFVFQYFIPVKIDDYFYFLFAGLLPWNFLALTVTACTPIILNERSLIQKAKFPREALPLSIILSNFFNFMISIFLLLIISMFIIKINLINFILLLFTIIWLLFFVSGLSLLLSTLFVRFRDIKFIVQALIPLWFYATPVMYTRSLLPQQVDDLIKLNPMSGIIELFQHIFVYNVNQLNIASLLPGFGLSLTIATFGIYIFFKDSQYFDDWL